MYDERSPLTAPGGARRVEALSGGIEHERLRLTVRGQGATLGAALHPVASRRAVGGRAKLGQFMARGSSALLRVQREELKPENAIPIPSFDRFIEPLLRLLAAHPDGIPAPKAQSALADQMGVTAEERRELLPSGVYPVYKSRIGWAHDRLKREGLSTSVKRGFWRITDKGLRYSEANQHLSEEEIRRLARPSSDVGAVDVPDDGSPHVVSAAGSPDDNIRTALEDIQQSLRRNLLDLIAARDPEFFEHLVLRLLRAIGYGLESSSIEHTGRSGDEGIDGVISLDHLGLDRVCVQAKRYERDRAVSEDEVDRFFAAVHRRGATKGVLITTGRFTDGARRAAESARGAIIRLIDGNELTLLMVRHRVGVRHEELPVPRIDLDFWEEE